MKILLAVGDSESRRLMKIYLSRYGQVDIAENGQEAVDSFLLALDVHAPYDVICLDARMPVLDGYQALSAIRAIECARDIPEERGVKVIMAISSREECNVRKGMEMEGTVFCGKPVDLKKIEKLLHGFGLVR